MLIEKINAIFPLYHSIFFQPFPIFSPNVHITTDVCSSDLFLEAILYCCDILMIGHAVPGIIGFQNLYRHLSLLQQLTDEYVGLDS